MDKSWTLESRVSIAYEEGVKQFLDFAFANAISRERIKCPCKNCSNVYYRSRDEVYEHLICDGFEKSYGCGVWVFHGEVFASPHQRSPNATLDEDVPDEVDDMDGMLRSAFGIQDPKSSSQEREEELNTEVVKFYKLVEDADQELYPGCKKFTKLAFVVRLYHIKCLNVWSDKSFTMLLELLKEAFPEGETLPKSFYETKKIIGELRLGYNKIDACPNDCMLYWKEAAKESACSVCVTSRWKANDDGAQNSELQRQFNERLSQHPKSSQSSTTRDDIFTQVMGEDRGGRVRTFGLGVTPDIFGPRASIAEARAAALESARIAEMDRAQRIALQEEVVQMRTQLNQLMTWMQNFNGSGPSSSSSVPVFGATPNEIQRDG